MLLGDSITQAKAGHYGYRYSLWKKLIDGGDTFDFVGSMNNNYNNTSGDTYYPNYSGHVFDKDHEGHSGWRTTDVYGSTAYTGSVVNSGSGDVAGWLANYTPDTVLILLGTNDLKYSTGYVPAKSNYYMGKILDIIQADNPAAVIYLAGMIPSKTEWADQSKLQELNGFLQTRSAADDNIHYVDLWSSISAVTHLYDGIHPNLTGEGIIAQKFYDAMVIPEPGTMILLSLGYGVVFLKQKRKFCTAEK